MGKNKKNRTFQFAENDCPVIFGTAEAFYSNGKEIAVKWKKIIRKKKESEHNNLELAVSAVNLIFSIELYLKGLYLQNTGKYEEGHSLVQLFETLPEDLKSDIIGRFDKKKTSADKKMPLARTVPPFELKPDEYNPFAKDISIHEFLKAHNLGFQMWRYHFDLDFMKVTYADFSLMLVMIECLVEFVVPYQVELPR